MVAPTHADLSSASVMEFLEGDHGKTEDTTILMQTFISSFLGCH